MDARILAHADGVDGLPHRVRWSREEDADVLELYTLDVEEPTLVLEGHVDVGFRDSLEAGWTYADRDRVDVSQ